VDDCSSEDLVRVVPRYFVDAAGPPIAKRRADRFVDSAVVTTGMLEPGLHTTSNRLDDLLGECTPNVGNLTVSLKGASGLSCLGRPHYGIHEELSRSPCCIETRANRGRDTLGHFLTWNQRHGVACLLQMTAGIEQLVLLLSKRALQRPAELSCSGAQQIVSLIEERRLDLIGVFGLILVARRHGLGLVH
jgi:hypothetical protein